MPQGSTDNGCSGGCSIYLCINEASVAYLAAHRAEETGIVPGATWRKVADDVALTVEVYPIAVAVLAGVELFPVITLHIDISAKHEINHLVLNEDIVHVVELFGTEDNVGIVLSAIALLIGVHHVAAGVLQKGNKCLHLPVLEVAVGECLLTFCQSILGLLSAIAALLCKGQLLLKQVDLDNKVGINVDAGLDTINGTVYPQQLLVAGFSVFRSLSRFLVGGYRLIVTVIVRLSPVCIGIDHRIIAVQN